MVTKPTDGYPPATPSITHHHTSGTSYTFTNVQSAHTIIFNWQEQYNLNVISDCGCTAGTGWYNSGPTAKFTVTQSAIDNNGNQVEFLKWNGTGKGAYTGARTLSR